MYELEVIEEDLDRDRYSVELWSVEDVRGFYRLLSGLQTSSAASLVECGDAFRSFDLLNEALQCYDEAIGRDSRCFEAYVGRGEIHFERAVCWNDKEESRSYALRAVSDFRIGMMLSLGASDLVWRLGTSLLIAGELSGAEAALGLAENVLIKGEGVSESVRSDFLYLLGFAKLFSGDIAGAEKVFEELICIPIGVGSGRFGRVVIRLLSENVLGANLELDLLSVEDASLWEAGKQLQLTGVSTFLEVARAALRVKEKAKGRKAE